LNVALLPSADEAPAQAGIAQSIKRVHFVFAHVEHA